MAGVPRGRPSRGATPCPFCGQRLLSNRAAEQVKAATHERTRELAALKRQLREAKRAQGLNPGEHGEFSEVEVSLRLIKAFPDDQITWTRPGRRGAEILQTVRFDTDGDLTVAGHVIYKCKDVQRWNAGFITQIKAAAKLAEAPYAILVSPRFPRNLKSVAVVDEVVHRGSGERRRPRGDHPPCGHRVVPERRDRRISSGGPDQEAARPRRAA